MKYSICCVLVCLIVVCPKEMVEDVRPIIDSRVPMMAGVCLRTDDRILNHVDRNPHQGGQQDDTGRDEMDSGDPLKPYRDDNPKESFPRRFCYEFQSTIRNRLGHAMVSPDMEDGVQEQ
jgi:hypothetical protein